MITAINAPSGLIDTAGCYADLDIDRYHGQCTEGPSISSSGLRTIFTDSPAHYWVGSSLNPNRVGEDQSEALILGRAAHHLLLGEKDFGRLFSVRPDKWDSWRSDAAKAWRADEEEAGRTVLLPGQLQTIKGMHAALKEHPLIGGAQGRILDGAIEQSLIWQDPMTGIWLKARPDAIPTASGDFADLKTAASVAPEDLSRAVSDRRYDMQAALVKWAAKAVLDIDMTDFALVFVEKCPPHCVEIRVIRPDDIAEAENDLRAALQLFAKCLKSGRWPGPGGSLSDLAPVGLSEFARRRAADRRAFIQQEIAA
ncbi:PD-(D/E)XK nuclease-like domain-containing protein [Mesorhizobium sp. BR1-1-16]|uniref:PD-(D/E)XK nuclease-like domain-containing protein n=1 Tax=Mesorhizobium sp. BR1-1-16 TaxID=2876653 RepID=UPI001CCC6AE4|nr:PD-(D/E)XK nuclease-like domain-containing protein [Mesorhizobium sp. BR1-1-16]MBZ9939180.1 PD-(D/E)XK nuclease-like domain-containing protein [Mesorhizobium sp. BR1-1-16]